jgi:hypothetical protein
MRLSHYYVATTFSGCHLSVLIDPRNMRRLFYAVGAALALCVSVHGQDGMPAHKISIPRRQELSGTISPSRKTKTFVVKLDAGLYRIT